MADRRLSHRDPPDPASVSPVTAEPIAHPLEPLTAPEFRATAAILRRDQAVGESWRFASIELIEPAKAEVRGLADR